MNPPDPKSKRRFERAKEMILINYRVVKPGQDLGGFDDPMSASTVDLSAGGMMLRMTESFPPKTVLELNFTLIRGGEEMTMLSVVVRCVPAEFAGVYYVAVDYPMLPDADRKKIDEAVKEINKRRGHA